MSNRPGSADRLSKRLIASYVLDWVVIICIFIIGSVMANRTPKKRPFALNDADITYPFKNEHVTAFQLWLAGAIVPAIVIVIVSLVLVPWPGIRRRAIRRRLLLRKLWELHAGLLGLAVSLVLAYVFTQGLKNLFGRPRPDLLARCMPDTANIRNYLVSSSIGNNIPEWAKLDPAICQSTDKATLDDGFRSFPSGHASTSWAGLFYLSLYLCSKLSFVPARLSRSLHSSHEANSYDETGDKMVGPEVHSARKSGAAPPLYLLAVILPPIGGALYISASRFFDFRHHAFDILFGSLIGILTAVFAFRWYHLPLGRGGGWAWSPRDRNSAFGAGVGTESYQTPIIQGDDYDSESLWERPSQSANTDIEMTGAVRNSQHVGPEPVAVP